MKRLLILVLISLMCACHTEKKETLQKEIRESIDTSMCEAIIVDNCQLFDYYRYFCKEVELIRAYDAEMADNISFYEYIAYYETICSIDENSGEVQYTLYNVKDRIWCYYLAFKLVRGEDSFAQGMQNFMRDEDVWVDEEWQKRIDVNSKEFSREYKALEKVMDDVARCIYK